MYNWKFVFTDAHEISAFDENGDEVSIETARTYHETVSPVTKVIIQAYTEAEAETINNNRNHHRLVKVTNNKKYEYNLTEFPYVMRRIQADENWKLRVYYVVGLSEMGNVFYMINDQGDIKQGNSKLFSWL